MAFGKLQYTNSKNEKFRSKLELSFSELMISNNIAYTYEGKFNRIQMVDSRVKVVDFIVQDKIIEITGFAYKKWQDDFLDKIKCLRKSDKRSIIILTYKKYVDYMRKMLYNNEDMIIIDVEDTDTILHVINKERDAHNTKTV